MARFSVKFKNSPAIVCEIDDTELGQKYFNLLVEQYKDDPVPIFRDPPKYTVTYLRQLATQAKEILNWNWLKDDYNLEVTTKLHKDIEQYLAIGYDNIPAEHDHLLDELHFCLHAVESGSQRNSWLQVEWFNDRGFSISPDEYPAKIGLDFGDIRLQNPYVGHHPLYLYEQRDNINIMQTCRFHDFAKPGFNLVVAPINKNGINYYFDQQAYLNWFHANAEDFISTHSEEILLKYTGHPVVGHVVNLDDLKLLIQQPAIEIERLLF